MLSSAHAQDLDRKVSYNQEASRASVLLPALGRSAGVALSATTRMGDEVLIINVHDVTIRDLMAKIAQVTQGEWKPVGDGFELSRPSSLQTQVERAETDARARLIQAKMDAETGRIAKLPEFTAAEAERMAKLEQKASENLLKAFTDRSFASSTLVLGRTDGDTLGTPAERGILAILTTIGAGSLATLADGQRVVFSSGPTRMQRPFPSRAHDLITQFVKDSLLYSAAKKKTAPDEAPQIQIAVAGGGEVGSGNPALGIGRSILTIQRQGATLQVSLIAADPNGASLATGDYSLSLDPESVDGAIINNNGPKIALSPLAAEFAAVNKPVVTSGSSISFASTVMVMDSANSSPLRLSIGDSGTKQIPISDALRARLLNPEKSDPQSLTVTEGLNAVASNKKANLVADISDDAILPLTRDLGAGKTADAFFRESCPNAGIVFEEKDGWLLAMSRTAVESRSRRMDRSALGRALRGLDSQTCLRLNQLCAFALAQLKPASPEDYDGTVMSLINAAGANDALGQLGQADVLRFFGSLAQAQQDGLLSGGSLSLSNLPPTAMAYLSNEVFQSTSGPSRKAPQSTNPNIIAAGTQALAQERTEYMPNGVPAVGNLRMKVDRQPGALAIDAEGKLAIYAAEGLASRLYQDQQGNIAPFGSAPKLDKFLPATQTQLSLHFEFPLLAEMDRSLSDTVIDRSQQAVTYEGLPADLKARIAHNLQTMKNTFGNMKLDFFEGTPAKTNIPPR